ncbi:amidohydrolase [Terasakiella pusilla]|uniref:amidohydrolase n=1 Tax=Terasakiella pusilla TaxID=64973 RepID=UPI003AA7F736
MNVLRFAMMAAICIGGFFPSASSDALVGDKLYRNAHIWTGDKKAPRAEAIVVKGARIIALGSSEAMQAHVGKNTQIINLAGAFVVPGFVDNHVHFLVAGSDLTSVNLQSATTPEGFKNQVAEHVREMSANQWILGGNWDHELWGGSLPDKTWIDDVTPDNPVAVRRLDGHMVLANSYALSLANITRDTVAPEGGVIVKDDRGEPTGILKDNAIELLMKVMPVPSAEEMDKALAAASRAALSNGITQVHDMGYDEVGGLTWNNLEAYRRARRNNALKLRVYSFMPLTEWPRVATYIEDNGRGDDWLRWGGLKGYIDGSLGSGTAWFHQPYKNAPDNSGFAVIGSTKLSNMIEGADAAGLHVAIHAIGDRANDNLLDIFESVSKKNGVKDRRFRIEHAQHLSSSAITRFAVLGVIPSMQPYHAIDDGRWAENSIGADRIKRTYPFRSLLDAGASLTFGSDWFVAPLSPLEGIYAAVTRRTIDNKNPDGWVPEQRITVEEALRAYTSANAYAGFMEKGTGTLEIGKLADFTVLSENILTIEPVNIPNVKVLRTVVGGLDQYIADEGPVDLGTVE